MFYIKPNLNKQIQQLLRFTKCIEGGSYILNAKYKRQTRVKVGIKEGCPDFRLLAVGNTERPVVDVVDGLDTLELEVALVLPIEAAEAVETEVVDVEAVETEVVDVEVVETVVVEVEVVELWMVEDIQGM